MLLEAFSFPLMELIILKIQCQFTQKNQASSSDVAEEYRSKIVGNFRGSVNNGPSTVLEDSHAKPNA